MDMTGLRFKVTSSFPNQTLSKFLARVIPGNDAIGVVGRPYNLPIGHASSLQLLRNNYSSHEMINVVSTTLLT